MESCPYCGSRALTPNVVVGRGNPDSSIMLIGEAPGAWEDKVRKPFVGRSGKLLENLLNNVGFDSSKDIYICNILKCRPPNNRRPTKLEIKENLPWLFQQIYLVDPKIILLTGATAINSFLGLKNGVSKIRGKWHYWKNRLVMPLFHPSYLLRNPSIEEGSPKYLMKKDLIAVRNRLESINSSIDMPVLNGLEIPINK